MQVAANLVNDFYRKRGSGVRAASLESNEIDVAGSQDPAELVLTQASFAEVVDAMKKQGNDIHPTSPEDAARFFRSEMARYAKIVEKAGIKLD